MQYICVTLGIDNTFNSELYRIFKKYLMNLFMRYFLFLKNTWFFTIYIPLHCLFQYMGDFKYLLFPKGWSEYLESDRELRRTSIFWE